MQTRPMARSLSTSSEQPVRSSKLISRTPFFYGWVVLAAGSLGIVMMGPSQTFTVSLFIDTFVADLGLTRATVSLMYGFATLGASLLLPVTGRLVDRYGPRKMMIVVTLAFVMSCALMSLVAGALTLFGVLLALRFFGFGSMQLVSNNAIAQWFIRRRGSVMGIAGQSLAVSLLFWPALAETLIRAFTWRAAWVGMSLLVLTVATPVAWLFFRDRPELYGKRPDGDDRVPAIYPEITNEENWTLSEAAHTGVFWIFIVALLLMSTLYSGLIFHQASLFQARGLSRGVAVSAFQVMAAVSIVGNLLMGWLLDKFSARLLLVFLLAALAASIGLIQTMRTPIASAIYAALIGLTMGGYRVMDATIWAKYFGRRHLGSIKGVTMVGSVGGTALGAFPLGLSYDLTGGYTSALTVFMLLPIAVSFMMIFVRRPHKSGETD